MDPSQARVARLTNMKNYANIPPEIARKLDESVGRVRNIIRFRGICATVAVLVASMLGIMAIDAMVTIFSSFVRWTLWFVGAAGTGAVAWFALLKPLRRKFTAAEIAALIERNHPELEERLSTVVELAQTGEIEASKELMAAITKDAISDAVKVSPQKEFTNRTVKPRLIAAGAAVAILLGLFAAFPQATLRLATRAIAPAAEVDNVYASSLSVSPGDLVVLQGSSVTVNLAVEGGFPSKAYVRTKIDGHGESVERMSETGGEGDDATKKFYSFNYPQVAESFTYRMNCGSALTRGYRVEVVPEPDFSDRRIRLVHPAYTGRAPDEYTNTAAIAGLQGTKVTVSVKPSRPGLSGAAMLPPGRMAKGVPADGGRMEFSFTLDDKSDGSWGIALGDANGFSNRMETASIGTVKDTAPEVKIIEPEQSEVKLPLVGELPLGYEITDDFGLGKVFLEQCVGAGAWENSEEFFPQQMGRSVKWFGDTVVMLAEKHLGKSGLARFRIRCEDNFPSELGGPHVAYSREITVGLVSYNTSLARQSLRGQIDESKKTLDDITRKLGDAKRQMTESGKDFTQEQNAWQIDSAKKKLDWAKGNIVNAENLMDSFIKELKDSRLETGVGLFEKVLKDDLVPVRQKTEDVYFLARNSEKATACADIAKDIDEALKELAGTRKKFDSLTKAAEDLQKLEDYAEREKSLAEAAEAGKIDAQEFADREAELERKFGEEFKDKMSDDPLSWQEKRADELGEKSDSLAARQDELEKRMDAARNGSAEEQKALSDAERQLANELAQLARQAQELANSLSQQESFGDSEENRPSEGAQHASDKEWEASNDAKSAADKMQGGDWDGAKMDMEAMKAAIEAAKQQLENAKGAMERKAEAMKGEGQEFKDMMNALHDAVQAAQEAAKQEQQQGQQQQGQQQDQQQGQQQQGQQDPQQGQQQPQQGQQPPQSPAMQQAQQKAKGVANKMKQQAQQQAQKNDLPMEQFENENDDNDEESDADSESDSNQQSSKSSSSKKKNKKEKPRKEKHGVLIKRGATEDDSMDWFKMKSESGAGAEANPMDDVPAEYRGLVREYFKALNEGGAK